ncbi:MAG: metallophosphoesterase [Christensenellaceae bacterium]|nr:metallophosphoesterase [Christensenellaceae bacterium]
MKKIGVISDTHSNCTAIDRCILKAPDVDMWLHLGDFLLDAEELQLRSGKPVHAVKGNCDLICPASLKPVDTEIVVSIEETKLLLVHGHMHGIGDYPNMKAAYRAEELGCNVLLYGHTHVSEVDAYGNLLIANPGSPSRPRQGRKPSFAILEVNGGKVSAHIVTL